MKAADHKALTFALDEMGPRKRANPGLLDWWTDYYPISLK